MPDELGRLTAEEKADGLQFLTELDELLKKIYWSMFHAGVGARFHAFLEWNGVMSKHAQMARAQLEAGIDPFNDNIHTGQHHFEPHHLKYLAEKIGCIFGDNLRIQYKVPLSELESDAYGAGGPSSRRDGKVPTHKYVTVESKG